MAVGNRGCDYDVPGPLANLPDSTVVGKNKASSSIAHTQLLTHITFVEYVAGPFGLNLKNLCSYSFALKPRLWIPANGGRAFLAERIDSKNGIGGMGICAIRG